MVRSRVLTTFSLSRECINTLNHIAECINKPKSRIVEDLIMGFEVKKVDPGELKIDSAEDLRARCDRALADINRILEDPRLKA